MSIMKKWSWIAYMPVLAWIVVFSGLLLCVGSQMLPSWMLYVIPLPFFLCMGPVVGHSVRTAYVGIAGTRWGYFKAAFFYVLIAICFCSIIFLALDAPFYLLRFFWGVRLTGADETVYLLRLLFSPAGE